MKLRPAYLILTTLLLALGIIGVDVYTKSKFYQAHAQACRPNIPLTEWMDAVNASEYRAALQQNPLILEVKTEPYSVVFVGYREENCIIDYDIETELGLGFSGLSNHYVDHTGVVRVPLRPRHVNVYANQGGNTLVFFKVSKRGYYNEASSCNFGSNIPEPGTICSRSSPLMPIR